MSCGCNKSIACTVKECTHNNNESNYCTLEKIQVKTHESHPTMCECVDCGSFECK